MVNIIGVTLTLCAAILTANAAGKNVLCYYQALLDSTGAKIDISTTTGLCTHMIYASASIDTTGNIVLDATALTALADMQTLKGTTSLKLMISVGGKNTASQMSSIIGTTTTRTALATSLASVLTANGLDGVDINWQYPVKTDQTNFGLFLQLLRIRVGTKLISVAVAGPYANFAAGYNTNQINQYADFVNIMAYYFHYSNETKVAHHSPLNPYTTEQSYPAKRLNVKDALTAWNNVGITRSKMILGLPFFGVSYTLEIAAENTIGSPTSGPGTAIPAPGTNQEGFMSYLEASTLGTAGTDTATGPYAYSGDQWVGYDDDVSIAAKVDYAQSYGIGGVMTWSIDYDDTASWILLNAIKTAISS